MPSVGRARKFSRSELEFTQLFLEQFGLLREAVHGVVQQGSGLEVVLGDGLYVVDGPGKEPVVLAVLLDRPEDIPGPGNSALHRLGDLFARGRLFIGRPLRDVRYLLHAFSRLDDEPDALRLFRRCPVDVLAHGGDILDGLEDEVRALCLLSTPSRDLLRDLGGRSSRSVYLCQDLLHFFHERYAFVRYLRALKHRINGLLRFIPGGVDEVGDLFCRTDRALREPADLLSYHREALAVFARLCRQDRGVEREKLCLVGDIIDDLHDLSDVLDRAPEASYDLHRLVDMVADRENALHRFCHGLHALLGRYPAHFLGQGSGGAGNGLDLFYRVVDLGDG